MRRAWIMLLTVVALLLGSAAAWWWSSPGQLWWMIKKWEWAKPDSIEINKTLNPQWSRLIRRGYVRPYLRIWSPAPSTEQQRAFLRRVSHEVHSRYPERLVGGIGIAVETDMRSSPFSPPMISRAIAHGLHRMDPPRTFEGENRLSSFFVEWLLPPDQHELVATIALQELGTSGMPNDEELGLFGLPPYP